MSILNELVQLATFEKNKLKVHIRSYELILAKMLSIAIESVFVAFY